MTLDEIKNWDPQRPITVKFGILPDTGVPEWEDTWRDVRLLVSVGEKGSFQITPMSLDGRPFGFVLDGHDHPEQTKGVFASLNSSYVMQVRSFLEPYILKEAFTQEDLPLDEYLENNCLFYEDLSPSGKVLYEVMNLAKSSDYIRREDLTDLVFSLLSLDIEEG